MLGGLGRGREGKGLGNCLLTADFVRGFYGGWEGKGREWGIVC